MKEEGKREEGINGGREERREREGGRESLTVVVLALQPVFDGTLDYKYRRR